LKTYTQQKPAATGIWHKTETYPAYLLSKQTIFDTFDTNGTVFALRSVSGKTGCNVVVTIKILEL
jgi:hypothetical protein